MRRWNVAGDRKYTTEFALTVSSTAVAVLQRTDLEKLPEATWEVVGRCHIYLICRRPKISILPESFEFSEERVAGTFRVQRGADFEEVPFDIPNRLGTTDVEVVSDYPHTRVELRVDGETIAESSAGLLMQSQGHRFADYLDLEVLYVGQAFGFEGARTAKDRLRSHETLQAIYAEALERSPDQDIWLVLINFDQDGLTSVIDGRSESVVSATVAEDQAHLGAVLSSGISEQQQVNITEAALIRYFDAPFNKTYRNSFPNPAHATYSECYELELNSVIVVLDTEYANSRLWSGAVAPAWTHVATFPLHSADDRKAMFDLWT
jgi:hypothetical protein